MYVRDNKQYDLREVLSTFVEGEFEFIFIEFSYNGQTSIVGEIYRIPNSNVTASMQQYESILNNIQCPNNHVIIVTDQNVDYLKIDSYKPSSDLLDIHLAANLIPTITKLTLITHTSAILIDTVF